MRSACRSNKTIAFTPEGRAVRLKIAHLTRYDFAEPAQYGLQQIRLTPKTRRGQSIEDWSVTFEGASQQVQFVDLPVPGEDAVGYDPVNSSGDQTSVGALDGFVEAL